MSNTPFDMESKCVRNPKAANASTINCGSHAGKAFSRIGEPIMTKVKQIETVKIKAITEFLVQADMHEPIASNPPAINQLPI